MSILEAAILRYQSSQKTVEEAVSAIKSAQDAVKRATSKLDRAIEDMRGASGCTWDAALRHVEAVRDEVQQADFKVDSLFRSLARRQEQCIKDADALIALALEKAQAKG